MNTDSKDASVSTPSSCSSFFQKLSSSVNSLLSGFFYKIGESNGKRPYLTIFGALVCIAILASGLADFQQESRAERLWVPQDTALQAAAVDIRENFGRAPRSNSAIFTLKNGEDGNVLSSEAFNAVLDVAEEVTKLEITLEEEQESREGQLTFNLDDLCIRAGPLGCLVGGILEAWDFNVTKAKEDSDPIGTLNSMFTKEELQSNLGNPEFDTNDNLISAEAIRLVWLLEDKPVEINGRDIDTAALEWELLFLDLMLQRDESGEAKENWENASWVNVLNIDPFAGRTFSDEVGGAISGDVGILGGSYILIIIYAIVVFSRWDRLLTGIALSGAAVGCVGGAIVASIGAAQYGNFLYGQTHSILPFVILGIGVDNSFVIYNAWRREEEEEIQQAIEEGLTKRYEETNSRMANRMARGLAKSGASITVTSLTNAVAFGIGSATVLPDFRSFCVYASLGVAFLWALQITVFSSAVILNARRIRAKRIDCCCCFRDTRKVDETKEFKASKDSRTRRFMRDYYAPFILDNRVRIFILVAAAAFVAGLGYNITNFEVQSTGDNFIPDSSYARSSLLAQTRYFASLGTSVTIVTREAPDGQSYFDLMPKFSELSDTLTDPNIENEPPYIDPTALNSWFDAFIAALERRRDSGSTFPYQVDASDLDSNGFPVTEEKFFELLRNWLDDFVDVPGFDGRTGVQFQSDIVWADPETRTEILRSRITTQHIPLGETNDNGRFREDAQLAIKALNGMIELAEESGLNAYIFSPTYLSDWQTFELVSNELVQNLLLALASVLVITTLLLGHPGASGLVFLMVCCTLIELLGVQPIFGLAIDTVSVVLFILAVGLAVDYSAHIALDFMEKTGTRKERVTAALDDIGVAIFNGGFSTFLAVLLQSASSSYVFRVVFYQFFGTILFGLLNGLVLLPIILSLIGPDSFDPSGHNARDFHDSDSGSDKGPAVAHDGKASDEDEAVNKA